MIYLESAVMQRVEQCIAYGKALSLSSLSVAQHAGRLRRHHRRRQRMGATAALAHVSGVHGTQSAPVHANIQKRSKPVTDKAVLASSQGMAVLYVLMSSVLSLEDTISPLGPMHKPRVGMHVCRTSLCQPLCTL